MEEVIDIAYAAGFEPGAESREREMRYREAIVYLEQLGML